MKFFGRKEEIAILRKIRMSSLEHAQFTVLTGRRRIGKTSLVIKAYEDQPIVYFFVGRKAETILCEEFRIEVESKLNVKMGGNPKSFNEMFEYLMELSKTRNFTLFIDELQNFTRVNPSIFSDMQKIWDLNHNQSRINLVVCGSIYSMMTRIFRDHKEPLYNRQNRFMTISAFKPSDLKEILSNYTSSWTNDDLLALYSFTGGVAKYVELLMDDNAWTLEQMIDSMVNPDSTFINEGRSILVEEFGKDYDMYFSILTAIATGKTKRCEIESLVGKQVSGYLSRLEDDYEIITKQIPIGAKQLTKNAIYTIRDNFFTFWFRFIFRYSHIVEINAYNQLRTIILRDYHTFSGIMLERYFHAKAKESQSYTMIGRWWDRKGENEIDLITANELEKEVTFIEIKRNRKNISLNILDKKTSIILKKINLFNGYNVKIKGLDLEDM